MTLLFFSYFLSSGMWRRDPMWLWMTRAFILSPVCRSALPSARWYILLKSYPQGEVIYRTYHSHIHTHTHTHRRDYTTCRRDDGEVTGSRTSCRSAFCCAIKTQHATARWIITHKSRCLWCNLIFLPKCEDQSSQSIVVIFRSASPCICQLKNYFPFHRKKKTIRPVAGQTEVKLLCCNLVSSDTIVHTQQFMDLIKAPIIGLTLALGVTGQGLG